MNLKTLTPQTNEQRFDYDATFVTKKIADTLYDWLPNEPKEFVVVCIGTDRSTGDSLGPLTGSLLHKRRHEHFHVYGTLENPVHAKNLVATVETIQTHFADPFIIAVDACLGRQTSIGSIIAKKGSLQPGAALKKDLPPIGNVCLNGVVNISGYMDYMVLQSTRLHIVMGMAETLAQALHYLHRRLIYPSNKRIKA
ncbi:hypothetical protein Pryu01_01583 [Paraliobacillus ryukyuensis]|uniref:Putative sporulation protein YyaC n=1 Tax=Paraliobacillus ryukyuensis TaxID=200904 RepID=A0A366EC25_9BACI|nr:spore protease YyaC [Paraliobacillus ryukyuensis]RBO99926.1 putative sporulation protein YyaC [Paraliobacillus ryukyuensis]